MNRLPFHSGLLLASMLSASALFGVNYTWNPTQGSPFYWEDNLNWTPNTAFPTTGDTAIFNNANTTATIGQNTTQVAQIQATIASPNLLALQLDPGIGPAVLTFDSGGSITQTGDGTVRFDQFGVTTALPIAINTAFSATSDGGGFLVFDVISETVSGSSATFTANNGSTIGIRTGGNSWSISGTTTFGGSNGTCNTGTSNALSPNSPVMLTGNTVTLHFLSTEIIPSLTLNQTNTFQNDDVLTLTSGTTALTMQGNVTWNDNANVSFTGSSSATGDIVYDASVAATASIPSSGIFLDFGAVGRTFNVPHNASNTIDMDVGAGITNTGGSGVTIKGGGVLQFSSSGANTYSSPTTVNSGTTLQAGAASAFSPNSSHVVNGTLNLNNIAQAIGSLAGAGSVTLGSGTLTTGSASSTTFSGGISGTGGLTKVGGTTFIMTGTNNYSGTTLVSGGTLQGNTSSLPGDITNNASLVFDQATTGTFAHTITGTGSLVKQNSGNLILTSGSNSITGATTVTGGRLSVNGSLITAGGLTVGSGATLGGTSGAGDAITGVITVNSGGTLAPGNSIGTLNVVGNVNLGNGATFATEINAAGQASLLDTTGSFNIGSNDTLFVTVDPGVYASSQSYTVVTAASGVTGQFATLTTSLPTFKITVSYPLDEVVLTEIGTVPFSTVITRGNAGAVAACLDTLTPASGSDMAFVQAELRMIPTVEGLAQALAMLQPSQFTALALAQEETTLYANGTIFQRLRQNTEICPLPCQENVSKSKKQPKESCKEEKKLGFWVSPFGGFAYQREQRGQAGFNTATGGVVTGLDYTLAHHWTLGGAVGYSYDHLKWKEGAGYANIQDGYGALYASFVSKYAYALGSMMGSYNHYNTHRHISIGDSLVIPIDRTAKASHNGYQASGHLQAGLLFGKKVQFAPFGEVDYIFVHEANFNERGAKSLDLHVQKKLSDLLQGEAGFEISRCFSMSKNRVSPSIGFSVIQEWRFLGKRYKSNFSGSSCVMHTKGMNPDRTLFSSECGLTFLLPDENQTLSLDYKGKWGEHFQDNRVMAQFLIRF